MKKNEKKIFKIVGVTIFVTVATLGVDYRLNRSETKFDFLLNQMEASVNSSEGWTKTSWNCVGRISKCYQRCERCETTINGRGDFTGSHSCGN